MRWHGGWSAWIMMEPIRTVQSRPQTVSCFTKQTWRLLSGSTVRVDFYQMCSFRDLLLLQKQNCDTTVTPSLCGWGGGAKADGRGSCCANRRLSHGIWRTVFIMHWHPDNKWRMFSNQMFVIQTIEKPFYFPKLQSWGSLVGSGFRVCDPRCW